MRKMNNYSFLKSFVLSLVLTICCLGASAQQGISNTQRLLGHIITDSITSSGGAFGTAGTYSVGAVLTKSQLSSFAGCRVMGVRLAIAGSAYRTRTFIYKVEEDNVTPVAEQKQKLYDGWNNVFFNGDGYEIKGDEILFFGFDYVETDEMIAADQGGLCGFGEDLDGGFYYMRTGTKTTLYQITGIGRLCVQLIIDVSSLPLHDIDLTWLDTGFKYKQPGESIEGLAHFASVGREDVGSYKMGYQIDKQTPVYTEFNDSVRYGKVNDWKFNINLPNDIAVGMHRIIVFVSEVNGQPLPEKSKNDTMKVDFAVYNNMVSRDKAYLEVYTDQGSYYVPYLNDVIKKLQSSNNGQIMATVNVHRPGTALAIDAAAYLHELYAYELPSFTVNRAYFPGEDHVAYDMNYYLPILDADMNASIVGDMILQDYYSPAFASVELDACFNETTREISINAKGTLLPEAEAIYGEVALTLMLTENNVKGTQVVYNALRQTTSTNKNYNHNNVLRTYLTSPIGDGLTAVNGSFDVDYKATVDEAWKVEDLTIVALLTKKVDAVTADNLLDVDVINANSLPMTESTGIRNVVKNSDTGNGAVYSLDGRRVDGNVLKSGIYVKNGKKVFVK